MSGDLELRAREAAEAVHRSVAAAGVGAGTQPPPRRPIAGRRIALYAGAVMLAGWAAVALSPDDESARIISGPAEPTATTLPPPPTGGPPRFPTGQVVATGTTSNGVPWTLHIGGPSNELCLSLEFDDRITGGTCAGRPFGQPIVPDERYRPLRMKDVRVPLYVFGRLPGDIVEIEVELGAGAATGRRPVLRGGQVADDDGFYAVELDRDPVAVIGIRADGTTVRYEVPQ